MLKNAWNCYLLNNERFAENWTKREGQIIKT